MKCFMRTGIRPHMTMFAVDPVWAHSLAPKWIHQTVRLKPCQVGYQNANPSTLNSDNTFSMQITAVIGAIALPCSFPENGELSILQIRTNI